MPKATYLDWIEDKINRHQTEIARLTIAREVVIEAAKTFKLLEPKQLPSPPPGEKPKRRSPRPPLPREEVLQLLTERGPLTSREVVNALNAEEKQTWNALYHMRKSGAIRRLDDGRYAMPAANDLGEPQNDQS